jgi:hypothetical protein
MAETMLARRITRCAAISSKPRVSIAHWTQNSTTITTKIKATSREKNVSVRHTVTGLILLLSLLSIEVYAQRKTDIVTFYNGDHLTGEIKSLYGGILEFSTDAMGTVKIEWPEISRIQSEYHYELRLSSGDRLYGSFDDNARPGQILLVDIFGMHEVEWLQVTEIRPIEDSFAERLEVYLSAGYSYSKASSVGQLTFNTQIGYEDENSQNTLTARKDITTTDENDTASTRIDLNRAVWRENRSDSFRAIFANYEDNDELELEYRIGAGGGIGRFFLDTHRSRFYGLAGLQVITEKPLDGNNMDADTSTNQDIEMIFSANYAFWKFNTPEMDIDLNFSLYPSLTDGGRVRSDSNLRIRWEIIEDLYWDITAWASTDNEAENSDRQVDYSITTGVGWEY